MGRGDQIAAGAPRASLEALERGGERYHWIAILLHWGIAALIFGQFALGWYMVDLPKGSPERSWFFALHKSMGLTTAMLIAVRIAWRLTHPAPALPAFLPAWKIRAAAINHRLLYLCMVLMPLSGYLSSSFTKYPMKFFGLPFPKLGWEHELVNQVFTTIHVTTSYAFIVLIVLHVAAATQHLLRRDGVFNRMLP